MSRKGFTLIELLVVVVIIGILAAIAVPKFTNSKGKAVLASMKSDLRNLATAQEGYFFDFATYAGAVGPAQALGVVSFVPTSGNVLAPLTNVSVNGWTATITNPILAAQSPNTCGIYVGPPANSPNVRVTQEAAPACW
jgi:type II secretion system protein G